jgi:hypothetical protein
MTGMGAHANVSTWGDIRGREVAVVSAKRQFKLIHPLAPGEFPSRCNF